VLKINFECLKLFLHRVCSRKIYYSQALETILIINCTSRQKKGSHLAVLKEVVRKLLCSKFNLEAGHHSYTEFALGKIYHSWALETILIINCKSRQNKGSHSAVLKGVVRKLLCSKFILAVGHHSYTDFTQGKIYHSRALETILFSRLTSTLTRLSSNFML
jgi:hypothetical protein